MEQTVKVHKFTFPFFMQIFMVSSLPLPHLAEDDLAAKHTQWHISRALKC